MAFMFLSIHYPKPEHHDDVLRAMKGVGDSLRGASGCVQIGPWQEEAGGRIVGLSIWESRADFERAMSAFSTVEGRAARAAWEERPAEEIVAKQAD